MHRCLPPRPLRPGRAHDRARGHVHECGSVNSRMEVRGDESDPREMH